MFQICTFICATSFLNNMGLFGSLFMVPIFLQQVIGLTPLQTGLVMVPAIIVSGLTGVLTGRANGLMPPPLVVSIMMMALAVLVYIFSAVTALTTIAVIVGYLILHRIFMMGCITPMVVLTVQTLEPDEVRMEQGVLEVVRSIGSSLGVTVTSVFFEYQRTVHQLSAYHAYDSASPVHQDTLRELKQVLHQVGMVGSMADQAALRTIRRQMDTEAIAAGFRDSFLLVALCFLLASIPMVYLLSRSRKA